MGSRGSFLESGGFSAPGKWHTVDYIEGIKVLAPKNPKASINLPERSNTPGTSYIAYDKDGIFKQLIVFDNNRMPIYEIDYGMHNHKKFLHVHSYPNGKRSKEPVKITKSHELYLKYHKIFKGVKL